ncbi:LysR family transcriptional regulator [Clostridium acetobutylicum]|nr:LysR family transcriptional regulator [Clostridium acetobutylicum]
MNIERFRYFIDLTKTLNFTETAEINFTTQSNVSKQIMALEKELDTILFIREHKKITLTEAGKALLPYAEKILIDYCELHRAILPFQSSKFSTLKICAIPVMANYNVPGIIAKFHNRYPDILLDVKEVESINILKELDAGLCDVAYTRIFNAALDKYEKVVVESDKFAVVLPKNHYLAKKEVISIFELKNELFFQLDKSTQLFSLFYSTCQKAGFEPKISYTGTRIDNILDFISNGMGISLMMQNSINLLNYSKIAVIPIDVTIKSELAFVRSKLKKHSSASNSFWNFLHKSL